ncbi:MAG: hypothetical protein ABSH45_11565 [Bryobacteraceae bacterium]
MFRYAMFRRLTFSCLAALLLVAAAAWAANLKLYLKEGGFQLVREYQVEGDKVRYYSVERGDWEEIPLDMVDLKRTQTEAAARQRQIVRDAKSMAEEQTETQAIRTEASHIPVDPGVYWLEGDRAKALEAAESSVHMDKGRQVLRVFSPVPTTTGRGALEIPGAHSKVVFHHPEQEFYIELSDTERFGILKLTTKGNVRVVEELSWDSVAREMTEIPTEIDILRQQLTSDQLYKIWPKQPLGPGEYAVVEFTSGKMNMQVWDFAIQAGK